MKLTPYQRLRIEYLVEIARANWSELECFLCGETNIRALTGGHKIPEGSAHYFELLGHRGVRPNRRGSGWGIAEFMQELRRRYWPHSHMRRLQIECANCNTAKQSTFNEMDDNDITTYIEETHGMAQGTTTRHEFA